MSQLERTNSDTKDYNVEHCGYLKKRSPKVVMGHRFWQTRWFVLKRLKEGRIKMGGNLDVVIEYYRSRKDAHDHKTPLGKMFCTYLKNVAFHPKGARLKPGKFRIELDGDHIFYLQAATHDDAEIWVTKLSVHCQNFDSKRQTLPEVITTKKYWKQEHIDLQTQGHTQRKRSMSQAISQEMMNDIHSKSSTSGPSLKRVEEEDQPSSTSTPKTPDSGVGSGDPRPPSNLQNNRGGRNADKKRAKMARANEIRKKREEEAKRFRKLEDEKNKKALGRLLEVYKLQEDDEIAFELLFRRNKRRENVKSPSSIRSPSPAAGGFSMNVTDEKGKTGILRQEKKKKTGKKRVGFFVEPEEELKCPVITDVEDDEREEQVAEVKKYLKKRYKLTDFHVAHLENRIIDLYDYGEYRANQELKDLEQALKKRTWDLLGRIGQGGFGAVFKGRWRGKAGKKDIIAIKIIDLEAEQDDDIAIVNREIDALTKSQFCDQLTKYYGSGITGSELWIAMEYVDGGSVAGIIKKRAMTECQIAVVCKEVIRGLQYLLQDGGKIHRDIKGANILISNDGKVKLADFGASRTLSQTGAHKAATFIGSPYWMAPEIVQQQNYDGKVDVWSLGCTCIEMATQHPPNYTLQADKAILKIMKDPPPKLPPGFSQEFNGFVNACLIKDSVLRPGLEALMKFPFIQNAPNKNVLAREEE
ncbi:hypothetical protein AAMO2058_000380500 [Amorphochlora amoebiformis]